MPKSIEVGAHNHSVEDIRAMLADERPILMLYRMQMCPHCVALQPTWSDVKRRLARDNGLVVAEVEYQHMGMLPASLRNIRGFPTIQVIQKGRVKDEYAGDRSCDSIVAYAKTFSTKPPVKSASTPASTKKTPAKSAAKRKPAS